MALLVVLVGDIPFSWELLVVLDFVVADGVAAVLLLLLLLPAFSVGVEVLLLAAGLEWLLE